MIKRRHFSDNEKSKHTGDEKNIPSHKNTIYLVAVEGHPAFADKDGHPHDRSRRSVTLLFSCQHSTCILILENPFAGEFIEGA